MEDIVAHFLMSQPMEDGPYFHGYCGEHQYQHPGVIQLAGAANDVTVGMYFGFNFMYCMYNWLSACSNGCRIQQLNPLS